jgi:V/A-type H+-transporting ATPase subunit C
MRGFMAVDFTYVVARLRALEAALPDRAWFERLVRSPEANILGSLREYFPAFEGIDSLAAFERGLTAEKASILVLVSSLLPDERTILFIRAGYDFDNVRHAWKASKLNRAPTALTPFGLIPPETVADAIAGEIRGVFPAHLERLLESLEAAHEASGSLAAAEYAAERAKWRFRAESAPDERAMDYLRMKIDLMNIKNIIRLERERLRGTSLETVWCEGGEIPPGRFADFFQEPIDDLFAFLETSSYRRLAPIGLAKDAPLWRIETVMRRFIMETLGESRYRHFDISPVLYHLELRERDEEIMRRVITGKLNRIPEEMLFERVEPLLAS